MKKSKKKLLPVTEEPTLCMYHPGIEAYLESLSNGKDLINECTWGLNTVTGIYDRFKALIDLICLEITLNTSFENDDAFHIADCALHHYKKMKAYCNDAKEGYMKMIDDIINDDLLADEIEFARLASGSKASHLLQQSVDASGCIISLLNLLSKHIDTYMKPSAIDIDIENCILAAAEEINARHDEYMGMVVWILTRIHDLNWKARTNNAGSMEGSNGEKEIVD